MSAIIKFPLERVQRRSKNPKSNGATAEILVFEGVQYVSRAQPDRAKKRSKHTAPATKR